MKNKDELKEILKDFYNYLNKYENLRDKYYEEDYDIYLEYRGVCNGIDSCIRRVMTELGMKGMERYENEFKKKD